MFKMIGVLLVLVSVLLQSHATDESCAITFKTWDLEKWTQPSEFARPRDEESVVQLVQEAAGRGEKVKVMGGGLSFTGVQFVDANAGTMFSLSHMNTILHVDAETFQVEVQAGITIRDLVQLLGDDYKLALPNLGATASQSIVGAAATGTHGTGLGLGGIATSIIGLRLVDASGAVHTASTKQNTDLFEAARTGVGALGIITSVTLQAMPLWKMRKTSFAYPLASLLDDLPDLLDQYDRLQWSFEPYTDNATVVVREDVDWDTPIAPSGLDGGCWSEHQPTADDCTDVSYKTLTDSLRHYDERQLYTEMEMFIAVEDSVQAVRDYMKYMESVKHLHDPSVTLNVMLRYVAADDIMLSPMHGRDTAVISVIVVGNEAGSGDQGQFRLFAGGLQALCEGHYSARPHWGKINFAPADGQGWGEGRQSGGVAPSHVSYAEYLTSVYPRWADYHIVMANMDPRGVFSNTYLRQRGLVVD